ncbi:hypothetical protein [Gloeobacter morelensis]|uniref:Uncharacterized protein n=1 Tax=Gloeobacter morelensis MG652769 TaxID=2781736 RepID=A0ABY3PKC8_9CYAN|nr:hypothetical protein [Gloeobacter morelensis]UFP94079.1 hypothetical protein ISF26_20305 [Gloeobacter morelensis MG652769]
MTLEQLQQWAQSQIDNTARPEVRPDIAVSILQLIDELEELKEQQQASQIKDKG